MNKKAFTIIEILAVVLIIGVLAAVALPMYTHSVHKSKYSTLIATAKPIADANERHYTIHNAYVTDPEHLDINISESSSGSNIQLKSDNQYSYVSVSRPDLPGNKYVIFQRYSNNFPSEAHCEAAVNDAKANWLCEKGLQGTLINGSITPNYNTYVISGTGNGQAAPALSEFLANIKCTDSENSGSKSCEVIINDSGNVTKVSCKNKNNPSSCSYVTYDDDGSQSTCYGSAANYIEGECIANKKGSYRKVYDEDGNLTEYLCNNYTSGSGCYALGQEQYDSNGTHMAAQNRYCEEWDINGNCVAYKQGQGNDHVGIFEDGHKTWVRADCQDVTPEGTCTSYKGGRVEEWDYDEDGTTLVYYDNTCTSMSIDYVCSAYSKYKTTTYSYNDDGRVENTCDSSIGVNVQCKSTTTNTYNASGKQTSGLQYTCNSWDANNNCTKYTSKTQNTWSYNNQGNETSRIGIACASLDSNQNCTKYKPQSSAYRTYTEDGKTVTSRTGAICNSYTGLNCTGGWTVTYTPYVNGKEDKSNETVSTCQNFDIYQGRCLD